MSGAPDRNTPALFFEIRQTSLQGRRGEQSFEVALEREAGELTPGCRAKATAAAREFLAKAGVRGTARALCAIDARGVSLRRLSLPPAPKEQFQRLLRLQIESEFPLPPEQLAWGWQLLRQDSSRQEVLVAATRKETLRYYAEIFAGCGVDPQFTPAALWRGAAYAPPAESCAVLDLGRAQSELVLWEGGFPESIRVVNWGRDNLAAAAPAGVTIPNGKLYLMGNGRLDPAALAELSRRLGVAECAVLRPALARTSAPLLLSGNETGGRAKVLNLQARKRLALAAALAVAVLAFPYAEALALKPFLSHRLASLNAGRGRLTAIDREIDFLRYLKENQPPYLDTLYLLAKSAPPGTSFESVTMGRRGDLALRGKLGNAQQVTDFRSKLIEAGWFSTVTVDEQTPTPDRRVTVRITAQLKAADSRKPVAGEPAISKK